MLLQAVWSHCKFTIYYVVYMKGIEVNFNHGKEEVLLYFYIWWGSGYLISNLKSDGQHLCSLWFINIFYFTQAQIRPGSSPEGGVSNSLVRSENPHHLSEVMSDIHIMKGRQEGIATVLEALKQYVGNKGVEQDGSLIGNGAVSKLLLLLLLCLRDNTHLRHEITVLKDKHVRQQKILNKVKCRQIYKIK